MMCTKVYTLLFVIHFLIESLLFCNNKTHIDKYIYSVGQRISTFIGEKIKLYLENLILFPYVHFSVKNITDTYKYIFPKNNLIILISERKKLKKY